MIISTGAQLEYVKIEDVKVTYGRNATLPCPYFEKTSNVSVSLLQCLNRYHYVFKLSIYRFHSNIKDIRTHNELKLNSMSILRSQINYCTKNRLWNWLCVLKIDQINFHLIWSHAQPLFKWDVCSYNVWWKQNDFCPNPGLINGIKYT